MAVSDFDGDGDLDLIVNNYRAHVGYFVNGAARGHWLQVRLRGRDNNRDGVGATLHVLAGGRRMMRVVTAGDGYASQYSRTAHFGLGGAPLVDELLVVWPNGERQTLRSIPADRLIEVDEDSGVADRRAALR